MTSETCASWAVKSLAEQSASPSSRLLSAKNTCRLVSWQLLLLLPPRLRLSRRRETRRLENISMMELFRFSLKKILSSDGILVYLLMALRCEISRLDTTNLLNFCYIQKFSKPFLFTSHRNILNPKLE